MKKNNQEIRWAKEWWFDLKKDQKMTINQEYLGNSKWYGHVSEEEIVEAFKKRKANHESTLHFYLVKQGAFEKFKWNFQNCVFEKNGFVRWGKNMSIDSYLFFYGEYYDAIVRAFQHKNTPEGAEYWIPMSSGFRRFLLRNKLG